MENENILPISCRTLYDSQERGSSTPIWLVICIKMLVRNYKKSIRIHDISLIIYCLGQ